MEMDIPYIYPITALEKIERLTRKKKMARLCIYSNGKWMRAQREGFGFYTGETRKIYNE